MKLLKIIARYKVYFDRARAYLTIFTFMAAWIIIFDRFEWQVITWLKNHPLIYYPSFVVLFLGGCLVVGYLDKKYIRPYEQKEITSTNPIISEIMKDIKTILNK